MRLPPPFNPSVPQSQPALNHPAVTLSIDAANADDPREMRTEPLLVEAKQEPFRALLGRVKAVSPVRRRHLAGARMCAERHALATLGRSGDPRRPRVLAYHAVGTPHWDASDIAPDRFRRHIESALNAGRHFVPAREIAAGRAAPGALALTFDDGVRSVMTKALPVLRELNVPATVFAVTSWADGNAGSWADGMLLDWRDLEQLVDAGISVASHSVTHRNFATLSPDEARFELMESRRMIESRLGVTVDEFAIPMGQSRDWNAAAAAIAADAGYEIVYAQSEERRFPGTAARTFITRWDSVRLFRAALSGKFDTWEEWY
jgi:peptidoglycan/xylan/chitin deacetylase (PgdA/CDA1 family)